MRKRYALLLIVAIFILPTRAHASQMTLQDLSDICNGTDEVSKSACRFYILGVTEGASIGAGVAKDPSHFCIPEGVSSSEMVRIVKKQMAQDLAMFPQDKNMPAVSFVAAVMMKAYPCKV